VWLTSLAEGDESRTAAEQEKAVQRETSQTNGNARDLTPEEGREIFDRQAQRYLKMSGAAFLEAWDTEQFNDPDSSPDVMHVAMLIPLVR